jgi:hypothetical protein
LPGTGTGRLVFDPDGADFVEVAIYDRASLMPGAVILGPAVTSSRTRPRLVDRL